MDLFNLTKRKKLDIDEKQKLISNPTIINGCNETLLQNYLKHNGCDIELMNNMVNNNHDINHQNEKGETLFHSCLLYCHDRKNKYIKINWLLDNNCNIHGNKIDLTNFMLYTYSETSSEYFNLIQKIYDMKLLETNLLVEKYNHINASYICDKLKTLIWYDTHFNMNYDFTIVNYEFASKYSFFRNPLKDLAVHGNKNCPETAKMFEYICNKNPNILNINHNEDTLMHRILVQCENMSIFDIAIRYNIEDYNKYLKCSEWDILVKYIQERGYSYYCKQKFIFGIINKKITQFPICLIKKLAIKKEDFNNYMNCSKYSEIDLGIYSDEYCQKIYDDITEQFSMK